ncbi:NAD(P)H-dependent oxidoreductase [Collinsella ihumii]|uniref:NAD(P)H-dependent oxidoreductase n=1 Tax=Collinsella ihumii TaxID=1720204 RepID=A0AAW7JSF0_9ACTN|nr:NAD(P)H-dependent oxidoreductase [Collinsella ihumii]MDN0070090.1 NAD(P)H-dependent oxidoreductase [Collinsella ihumii]
MAAPILVIVAHPDLAGASRVHKRWVEELAKHPDEFEVRDLYALYPNGAMDDAGIAAERATLEAHGTVVFQFPVYWYSAPALLRTWTDEVYGFGWAYGGETAAPGEPGRALAGKHFAVAMSAGDIEANYCAEGTVGFTPSEVIVPFRATANYVGATCEPEPFALFGTENGLTDEELERSAAAYVSWLRGLPRG